MKNYTLYKLVGILIVILAFTTSCEIERKNEGNGNVTTKRRSVQSFKELNINGIFTVYLLQSNLYKVEVITDDNLQEIVKTKNIGDVLYLESDTKDNIKASRMDVYISVPDIKKIRLEGVTSLYCEDTLKLDDVTIEKNNTGFMRFNAVLNNLTIYTTNVGDLELNGKSNTLDITNEMTGNIYAYGFKTNDMTLTHNGTGNVQVNVSNSIDVNITGVGNIYCKGAPKSISKNSDGVGRMFLVN